MGSRSFLTRVHLLTPLQLKLVTAWPLSDPEAAPRFMLLLSKPPPLCLLIPVSHSAFTPLH